MTVSKIATYVSFVVPRDSLPMISSEVRGDFHAVLAELVAEWFTAAGFVGSSNLLTLKGAQLTEEAS